jgi:N-acetylmuramate 1-kinase
MQTPVTLTNLSEPELLRLAEELAFALMPGDAVALEGDLGAGKTTFARGLISALSNGAISEVPSPTFTLVQTYETRRFEVAHFDLYRLTGANELGELGLDLALKRGIAIIEWPSRAADHLPRDRITVTLSDSGAPDARDVVLTGTGSAAPRVARLGDIRDFVKAHGWDGATTRFSFLQGDASPRRYARLCKPDGTRAVLMDAPRQPDGPPIRDGKSYGQIAHLAEDVSSFIAVANALSNSGFSSPGIYAHDMQRGFLLIEDLGDRVFGPEVLRGGDQAALWTRGTDTLLALRQHRPPAKLPLPDGSTHTLPLLDRGNMQMEVELLVDWYWPAQFDTAIPAPARAEFLNLWNDLFTRILESPKGWLLRDYHSPNLLALDARPPPRDVGIIDFQDALLGPEAYDLVSLLQDARVDVPATLERTLLDRYCKAAPAIEPGFDESQFRFAYAALGAQRNTKILGIFARLAKRDGKRQYLAHIPRIWGYLARDLTHPELAGLRSWYDEHLPAAVRSRELRV